VYKTVITETVCKSMIMEPGCQEPNDKNEMTKMKCQKWKNNTGIQKRTAAPALYASRSF